MNRPDRRWTRDWTAARGPQQHDTGRSDRAISSARTIEKKPITNHRVLNEAYEYSKPSSFSRGVETGTRRVRHPAHLGHGEHRRTRQHGPCGRLPRPTAAHVDQHHGASGERGRRLEGHCPHHLLPARHRPRL
ncbi:MAG: hypothetical protein MZV70_19235 [Desulfobacterales bacterium]|nr:hypothetical protein [Desulfobacterales bacterium]